MRKQLLPLFCMFPILLPAQFFTITLSPTPETTTINFCNGEATPFPINFSIADDLEDEVLISWAWTLTSLSAAQNIKAPEISTDAPEDNSSGTLPDGGLLNDILLLDASKADAGSYLLTLSVNTTGAEPEQWSLFEYPVYVDAVGSNDFEIDASAVAQNGKAVICDNTTVQLFPNSIEQTAFTPYTYNWSGPGNFSASNTSVNVSTTGQYQLTVTNACGESQDMIQVESGGTSPDVDGIIINWPIDNLFRACPAPGGIFTMMAQGDLQDYDFKWQVKRPGETTFSDFQGNSGNMLQAGVDGILHQDGSVYQVLANNDGCLKAIEEQAGVPAKVTLETMEFPLIDPIQPSSAMIGVGEMITFESTLHNSYGENSFLIWELEYEEGGEGPVELNFPDGSNIDAGSLITVSGTETIARPEVTIDWQVIVSPVAGTEKVESDLRVTYKSGNVISLPIQVRLRVVNKDDNNVFITGITRQECEAAVAEALVILPVELLYFQAFPNGENIQLKWATATETGNDFFTLERSFDGVAFSRIATIAGSGTTLEEKTYQYLDEKPGAVHGSSLVYYRLKQTDFDGRYSYSPIVSIEWNDSDAGFTLLKAFPTDDRLQLNVHLPSEGQLTARIFDIHGRLVRRQAFQATKGWNERQINLPKLSQNIYLLQLQYHDQVIVRRFFW